MNKISEEKITIFPKPFYYMVFSTKAEHGSSLNIVTTLFSNASDSLKSEFEKGFRLRYAGWDLEMRSDYKINLHGIESKNRFKRVQVNSNGVLIVEGALIPDFLCWGDDTGSRIHPLALIEFTYNAVFAFSRVIKNIKNPASKVECLVGFAGLQPDKHHLVDGYIGPGKINFHKAYWNGEGENEFTSSFDTVQFKEDPNTLGRITYEIVQQIYQMFGFNEEKIPYTTEVDDVGKIISVKQISSIV